jgi:uracil-DNA glycosylase
VVSARTSAGRRTLLHRLYAEYAEDPALAHMRRWARGVVPGDGPVDPRLMFVGEAPGRNENKLGRPFVGASGQLLNEMLDSVGLKREEVFITNAVKYWPTDKSKRNRPPTDEEIMASIPYLRREHRYIGGPPIVMLGKHAKHATARLDRRSLRLGNPELGMKRGEWTTVLGVPMLPLYHPAYGIYQSRNKPMMFEMFKAVLTPPEMGW